jgi:hypothetical protein
MAPVDKLDGHLDSGRWYLGRVLRTLFIPVSNYPSIREQSMIVQLPKCDVCNERPGIVLVQYGHKSGGYGEKILCDKCSPLTEDTVTMWVEEDVNISDAKSVKKRLKRGVNEGV